MARLRLSLLGNFEVTLDGEPVTDFGYEKVRALLAYLAVEVDRSHRREALAGLLWPEYPERKARQSLSQALSTLRQVIDDHDTAHPFLIATQTTLQFNPASDHRLDVTAFTAGIEVSETPDHAQLEGCPACLSGLTEAVDLYKGDFLHGFSIDDAPLFDEWCVLQRERLHRLAMDAMYRLTDGYEAVGEYQAALRHALRQVELDPWQERAHRQLMVLYARTGQRALALRQYEACRLLLLEELGVPPSERTQELHQRLLEGDLPAAPTDVTADREREPRTVGACPYRGLAAFREADAPFFFGREGFTEMLFQAVKTRPLVAVIVGSSGSGKSSAVFAGLLPRLRSEGVGAWLIVDCRPGAQPFQALAGALLPNLEPELSETDWLIETGKLAQALRRGGVELYDVLVRALEKNSDAKRILLLVDQFEELYTLCPEPDARRRFLEVLLAAVETAQESRTSSLVLLLTLRADFMEQALAHRPFTDALQEAALMLGPMTREELRAAIEKPAERQGAAFEPGLVERLLEEVGEEPGKLPLLEFALTLLWGRLHRGWMTHDAYEAIGRVEGALARYADKVYAGLTQSEGEQARRIFVQLVQPGEGTADTRRVATRSELGAEYWPLVQHLADKRLVVTGRDAVTGVETVEVVHEALIQRWERLQEWMEGDRAFRTWQERLRSAMRGWEASGQDEGALLRGVPLTEAEGWYADRGEELSPAEVRFIQAGVALREQRQAERERRRRRAVLALAGGLVVALILILLVFAQWRRAEGEEQEALRQASVGLAAQALSELEGAVPERAVLLALEALESYPYTPQVESALAYAVYESKPYVVLDDPAGGGYKTVVEWSPDGRYLAVGKSPTEIALTIWDANAGNQVVRFEDEGMCATRSVAWSPTGDRLLVSRWHPSLSECHSLKMWDVDTESVVLTLDGHAGAPGSVDWSPDGASILSAGDDGVVKIWNAATGAERLALPVAPNASRDTLFQLVVRDAAWSPAGDRIVTAAQNKTPKVWDAETGTELLSLSGHAAGLTSAAWSPDGARLATASQDGTVRVWDAATGEDWFTLSGHSGEVKCVAWSPDGERLATAGADSTVRVWNVASGAELSRFRVTTPYHVAWSPAGRRLAVRGELDVRVFDLSEEPLELVGHTDTVVDARWSPDGTRVATAGQDGTFRIWEAASGEESLVLEAHPRGAGFLSWSPDGARIVTTGRGDPAKVWDSVTGELLLEVYRPGDNLFYAAEWSPDGSRIVASSFPDHSTVVFDAETGRTIAVVQDEACGFLHLPTWSPDGDRIITGCMFAEGDRPARVWNAATGEQLSALESQDGPSIQGEWSPDGERIAVGYGGGTAKVWDASGGEVLLNFAGHAASINDLTWSPDGARIASGDEKGVVKVWDASTGEEVLSFEVPGFANRLDWSPDGRFLIVAGSFQVPVVRRVWQSTEELVDYARDCCVFRELTEAEREQYGLPAR